MSVYVNHPKYGRMKARVPAGGGTIALFDPVAGHWTTTLTRDLTAAQCAYVRSRFTATGERK